MRRSNPAPMVLCTAILAGLLGGLDAAPARAQDASAHDPARLFPSEAPVDTRGHRGLVRLPLTAEVLERTRPDLSDLRLHDANGRDVAFLVDSGARPWPADEQLRYSVEPLAVERRVEQGDSLRTLWREVLQIAGPGDPPAGSRWVLVLESSRATFVRDVVVRRLDGEAPVEIARASVFRFQEPLRERLFVALPSLPTAHGEAPRLEIELLGEGGYVEPSVALVGSRVPLAPTTYEVPLVERSRADRDHRTFIDLERPVGVAPDRIRLTTETGHFHRSVRVLDLAQGRAPREIGRGVVFRARELSGAEELEIDVSRASGEAIRVEVEDGDSPPLEALGVAALVRQPVLVFDAPSGPVTLRFGGGRAHAPRYDLAQWSGTRLGEIVLSVALPEAELGPVAPNPRFDDGPALRFAMRAGRAPDEARFTHVSTVRVEGAREGLSRLRLPADVLAAAREDLADVRVVDAQGQQWPYLRAPQEISDPLDARVEAPRIEGSTSTYVLHPPVSLARVERVVLQVSAPYVERAYTLRAIDANGRRVQLARGRLTRSPEQDTPLAIDLSPTRVSRLELEIEDGSDAPLAIDGARLLVPSPSLFLAAPDGDYRLLYGDADATPPRYEIEAASDLVLSVLAAEAVVGAARANPAHVEPPWYESGNWQTWLVWAVLLLAVLVLGLVTARIARQGAREPGPPPEGAPSAEGERAGEGAGAEPTEPPDGREDDGTSTKPVSF